jgi:hypothetical protein
MTCDGGEHAQRLSLPPVDIALTTEFAITAGGAR